MSQNKVLNCLLFFGMISAVFIKADDTCCSPCTNSCATVSQNLWQPRAMSSYASDEILILKNLDLSDESDTWVNRFGVDVQYMQSFKDGRCNGLGALPFWSGTNTMTIGNNNGESDLDAYQFGMGEALTQGSITITPKIQHVGADFVWYGLENKDRPGFYAKLRAPLGAMMVDICINENTPELSTEDILGYPWPLSRFESLTNCLQGGFFSQDPLYNYGFLPTCKQTVIRLGDIVAAIGFNAVADEDKLFGVGFKVSMPTGNVPRASYMLEPIFGRAGHWGVGGEIMGFWNYNCSEDSSLDSVRIWGQGEIMHLFSGRKPSMRSFDLLANGKGSKYLLLQHYSLDRETGTSWVPDIVMPAINMTTLPVNSTFGIEGNFALSIDFIRDNWNFAVIGEVWGRSQEKLSIVCCPGEVANTSLSGLNLNQLFHYNLNNYAVLGRQTPTITFLDPKQTWCEPLATINKAIDDYDGVGPVPDGIKDGALPENRIPFDYSEALDICGAQADSIVTGKILLELGYTYKDNDHVPHVSIFGGVECSGSNKNWPYLWSAGIQGSLQF